MRGRALAAFVVWCVTLGPLPVHAQVAATGPSSSWRFDVGVNFSPWFGTYIDAVCCRALGGWVGFAKGRLGFQFDHVSGWSSGIYDILVDDPALYEQLLERYRNRMTTALVDWQVFRSRGVVLRVRGGMGVRADYHDACISRRGESFTDEELALCEQRPLRPWGGGVGIVPHGGIAADFPVSERVYARVETRFCCDVRFGAGFGF